MWPSRKNKNVWDTGNISILPIWYRNASSPNSRKHSNRFVQNVWHTFSQAYTTNSESEGGHDNLHISNVINLVHGHQTCKIVPTFWTKCLKYPFSDQPENHDSTGPRKEGAYFLPCELCVSSPNSQKSIQTILSKVCGMPFSGQSANNKSAMARWQLSHFQCCWSDEWSLNFQKTEKSKDLFGITSLGPARKW